MLVPRTKSTRLVLPRGVAGSSDEPADADEGTLSYDTATGLIRIKTSAGWVDATGGGGGGGVTTFNGRSGAVVPMAGDYTPALVGLGSVTNDAQWASTLSAQISALGTKTALADADVIPFEDSAAGFGKKKFTASTLRAYATQTSWRAKPAAAGALDDEFWEGVGSSDLATRGWTVTNDTGAAMTRVGDVTVAYPSGLSNVQYRSTLVGGVGMLIQSVHKMNVSKAVTGTYAFSCDMGHNQYNTDTAFFYEAPMMWDVTTPKLDNTMRRVYIGDYNGSRFGSNMNINQVYTTVLGAVSSTYPSAAWYGWLDWDQAANRWRGLWADPVANRHISQALTLNAFTFTLRSAGFGLATARVLQSSWVIVRSFRQMAYGTIPTL